MGETRLPFSRSSHSQSTFCQSKPSPRIASLLFHSFPPWSVGLPLPRAAVPCLLATEVVFETALGEVRRQKPDTAEDVGSQQHPQNGLPVDDG
jgi:hypothetical protein